MKIFGKIIEYILYAGIAFVALLVLASVVPVPGGIKTYVVRSGSMEPAVKTGAVVVVVPRDAYKVGDVITFRAQANSQTPTTHRIVEVTGTGAGQQFLTKGDANEEADGAPISVQNVIGRVMLDIPYLGYAVAAAQKPIGFIALVILPALIVVVDQIQTLVRELRKKPDDEVEDGQEGEDELDLPSKPRPARSVIKTKSAPTRLRLRSTSALGQKRSVVRVKSKVSSKQAYAEEA